MIDINLLRKQPDVVRCICAARSTDVDIDRLIDLDTQFRQSLVELESLRNAQRRTQAGPGKDVVAIERARLLKEQVRELEGRSQELKKERDDLWARVPNLFAPDTPEGKSDGDNVELYRSGITSDSTGQVESHEVIGKRLGILDLERGAEVAGSGFYYWRGAGARLAWGVFSFALDLLQRKGFDMLLTPLLARREVFFGTGYLPFFEGEIYQVQGQNLALIGTSEQTLIGYYGNQILRPEALPIKITAFSPCFRTEAGAAGRASRGAFRVHQFHKVEQIVICQPEQSEQWFNHCQENAQELLDALEIPYRVVRVCMGDLGAPAYKKIDTEAWFPGFGEYRETHSNSNLLDYQARRFKIRFKEDGRNIFPHTISATGITDRAVLAILENHSQPDGSVRVPPAVRPYLGGMDRIAPPNV